ncbi:cytochrome P450 76A2-like [Neltuma alba]|uniref:cytochrome P450 76A2-like n=1 Tax=Neltuma alba TaxID=207710 RepID=UPI0010A47A6C|nr:cytochrome P450 76A2-like [Prosopis alba]
MARPLDSPLWYLLFLSPVVVLLLIHRKLSASKRRLPPGPPGWPLFGNMFQLGPMPHRTLAHLKDRYGPVVWLRIGATNTMAILSTKTAAEFFKNHDLSFAERTITDMMRVNNYDKSSLALAPYGSYWRIMRRLVTVDMLVAKRLNETAHIRRKCVDDMLVWIAREANKLEEGRGLHVARYVFLMSFNLLGNLMLSRDLFDPESNEGSEFFTAMMGMMEWTGHANVVDLFPWLRWLDPQGLRRNMERDMGKALVIASKFVKERIEKQSTGEKAQRDFLDVLLEHLDNDTNEESLNIFILELFLAGSETTSSAIEWSLTELLCNPETLTKAKAELSEVVGSDRKVEESDIENLPYLQAVIKETLRLHPPIPMLVPRRAIHDTEFMGYFVPRHTQVFVNAWAIGRDPDAWEDPLAFKPERFLGSKIDYKGSHYELIPFGAGRRMCAGVPLAHRTLHLVLSSLLHHFDWTLAGDVTPSTMDTRDRLGITMRKLEPLFALPKMVKSES